ncbi:MAG: alkaline phosphatase family protein [Candidatus Aenigmarchaeota archaeon]|nr:alkaline phosphatase family protein [Candidatus Aenigmarchaeota archaeon]
MKVIVIGIDGGTWPSFDRFSGSMPFLASLKHGSLETTIPTGSAAAWTSFSTGKNPGKHGIVSWETKPFSGKIATSRDIAARELWDMLSVRVGVMCPPISFPPKEVNGFYISGIGRPSTAEEFTYPPEEAENARHYIEDLNTLESVQSGKAFEAREKIKQMTENKVSLFLELTKKYKTDFSYILMDENDRFQHFFWKDESALMDYYSLLDAQVKRICDENRDANVFVLSDHSFHDAPTKHFHINTWLANTGYIKLTLFDRIKILLYPIGRALLGRFIHDEPPAWMKRFIPHQETIIKNIQEKPDFIGFNNFSLFVKNKDKVGEIVSKLKDVKDGDRPIFTGVWQKSEVYSGPLNENMPDIVFMMDSDYAINTDFSPFLLSHVKKTPWQGYHTFAPDAIITAFGPDIKESPAKARIIDITPTILHMFNAAVPEDCDGRVMTEILKDTREVKRSKSSATVNAAAREAEDELVKKKLRDLGYM